MKLSIILLIVFIAGCIAWSKNIDRTDNSLPIEQLSRVYQSVLRKSKRSRFDLILSPIFYHSSNYNLNKQIPPQDEFAASMGLSLAEYMASPQSQDNFHFIPIIRR
ncbi:hypothetical protein X798_02216 [Onchocerca flexuosa]|uniref:Uncharacterized protein n=2 Tax=Onchocerca flexuosa TaxID=387005 RepID=A0A183GYY1_9BILA|nr:hypothetical protein X798_02216 [Onchocerca flexuosa]VDO25808.1 unnamed protein product [Onchocerca flexuosa]